MKKIGLMNVLCSCRLRTIAWLAVGLLFSVTVVQGCSWSYLIWGLTSKSADPLFRFVKNGKAGYIDSSGKVVLNPSLPVAADNFFGEFHEGLLAVKEDRGYKYLNRSGNVVFHSDAWLAFDFAEGLAPASRYDHEAKWGFLNRAGSFTIPPQYFGVEPFSEGLARVAVSSEVGSTGYIDNQGQFVIPPRLTYGADFHEGLAAVIIDGPCRITNGGSCGRAEFRPTQTTATSDCRYAFIDKTGKPISDLRFDDAKDFADGLAPVRIGTLWGYVDRAGQMSISPKFDSAEPFSEGLAAVYQDGKAGFIDHSGNIVITLPQLQSADSFANGRALVSESRNGQTAYRFIDKTGKPAFPGTFTLATSFNGGLAHVAVSGGFAWIDTSGKTVFTYNGR